MQVSNFWDQLSRSADYVVSGFAKVFLCSLILWMMGLLWVLLREVASQAAFSLRDWMGKVFKVLIFSFTWGAYLSVPIAGLFLWWHRKSPDWPETSVFLAVALVWAYVVFCVRRAYQARAKRRKDQRQVEDPPWEEENEGPPSMAALEMSPEVEDDWQEETAPQALDRPSVAQFSDASQVEDARLQESRDEHSWESKVERSRENRDERSWESRDEHSWESRDERSPENGDKRSPRLSRVERVEEQEKQDQGWVRWLKRF